MPAWFTPLTMALLLIASGAVVYYYNEFRKKFKS